MAGPSRQAFLGAGANLGDRAATLASAVSRLRGWPGIERVESSSIYETEPLGVVDQPMFLNLLLGIETTLSPEELLAAALEIERQFGRVRTQRWGPRTLDLDLLCYEGETRDTTTLQLPHPRMLSRAFVVVPLRELLGRKQFQRPVWHPLVRALTTAPAEGSVHRTG